MSSDQASQSQPSLIGGHAKYVQGALSSALGYSSGETTKSDAISEMREARQVSEHQNATSGQGGPAQSGILGQIEKTAGDLTGCEGMSQEGAQRVPRGSEEASGTG